MKDTLQDSVSRLLNLVSNPTCIAGVNQTDSREKEVFMTKRQKVYWENLERNSKPAQDLASHKQVDEADDIEGLEMEEVDHDETSK